MKIQTNKAQMKNGNINKNKTKKTGWEKEILAQSSEERRSTMEFHKQHQSQQIYHNLPATVWPPNDNTQRSGENVSSHMVSSDMIQ